MIAMSKMKKTVNFLNAIKAAKGSTVTQYELKILVVHIIIEYGMIILIASFLKLVLKTAMNRIIFTIRWTKNAFN